jgi:hypothetical protein
MVRSCTRIRFAIQLASIFLTLAGAAWGAVSGSIAGTVKDQSGSVVPNADVTARELGTGISHETHTNASGYYTLPVLPVGRYELEVQAAGFRSYKREDVVLDTDAVLTLDCSLAVGENSETVTVTDNALHVETVSTQTGEVISGRQMARISLPNCILVSPRYLCWCWAMAVKTQLITASLAYALCPSFQATTRWLRLRAR